MGLLLLGLAACSSRGPSPSVDPHAAPPQGTYKLGQPYRINGIWYYPEFDPAYDRTGIASWYGAAFHGRPTANGETFNRWQITAAHPTLPLPSIVEVTNLENGRSLTLRVNDRGPFHDDRLIDLSQAAARELGFEQRGLTRVRVRFVGLAPAHGTPPIAGTTTRPKAVASVSSPRPIQTASTGGGCGDADHFVQVGAFREPSNAERLAAELRRLGRVEIASGAANVARVRLGPFTERGDAFGVLAEVQGLGYRDAHLVACS